MTTRKARTSLIFIWICSVGIASPTLIARKLKVRVWLNHTEQWCDDDWPTVSETVGNYTTASMPSRTAYYVSVSVILYFVPMLVMTIAYSIIIVKLWLSKIPGERVDSRIEAQSKIRKKVFINLSFIKYFDVKIASVKMYNNINEVTGMIITEPLPNFLLAFVCLNVVYYYQYIDPS